MDVRVRVCEGKLPRETVTREVAVLELELDALAALVAGVETRNEPRLLIQEEVLNLVLRLPQERRQLERHLGALELVLPRDVVVDRGWGTDRITGRRAAVLVEVRRIVRRQVFLQRIILLERRVRRLRVTAVREAEDVLRIGRVRSADARLVDVESEVRRDVLPVRRAITRRAGLRRSKRQSAVLLGGLPLMLLMQLSRLKAFVQKSRAASVSVFEPLNVKLSRRTPRLKSHRSDGRNSSVSEAEKNFGMTWLYVACRPFSASKYSHGAPPHVSPGKPGAVADLPERQAAGARDGPTRRSSGVLAACDRLGTSADEPGCMP